MSEERALSVQMLSDHLIDRVVLQSLNYSLHHHPDNPHVILAPASSKVLDVETVSPAPLASRDHAAELKEVTIEQP